MPEGSLTALELGDEAVVSVADFTLQGRAMRNVRQMVGRVCRQGYVAEIRRLQDIPQPDVSRLVRQADSWRGSSTERGFSMALGRVGGAEDGQCVVATATQDGVLRAVLHFVPWGCDGLSLDLMRRDRSAAPGLNDFLIVEAIKAAGDLGVKRISLNFAVFRAALERGEKIGAGPVLRAWRGVLIFLSRWFQIESLYKFNAKFSPEWVPRFLVFPGTTDAPRIGLAALEAEAFLVWPTVGLSRVASRLRPGRLRRESPRQGASARPAAETGSGGGPRHFSRPGTRLAVMTSEGELLAGASRCLVMGVVNVTPDSFSDGGTWLDPDKAIAHGLELASQGADIIDVGGESTRPGAQRVPAAEEIGRILPVVTALAAACLPGQRRHHAG